MSEQKKPEIPPATAPEETPPQVPAKKDISQSERFTQMVMREFSGNVGGSLRITDYQRRLIERSHISILECIHLHAFYTPMSLCIKRRPTLPEKWFFEWGENPLIKEHELVFLEGASFKCPECERDFASKAGLASHMKTHVPKE
jgi:hypothetical protein